MDYSKPPLFGLALRMVPYLLYVRLTNFTIILTQLEAIPVHFEFTSEVK
jgi:hypothetical protein